MKQKFKTLAYDWLPPAILRQIRRRRSTDIRFEEEYATWKDATENCTGYDSEGILEKVLEATLKVKNGEAVYERDSVLFDHIEYSWPVLSGLMWVAARNNGRLNVWIMVDPWVLVIFKIENLLSHSNRFDGTLWNSPTMLRQDKLISKITSYDFLRRLKSVWLRMSLM